MSESKKPNVVRVSPKQLLSSDQRRGFLDRNQILTSSALYARRHEKKCLRSLSPPVADGSTTSGVAKPTKKRKWDSEKVTVQGLRCESSVTIANIQENRSARHKSLDPMRIKVQKAIRVYNEELEILRIEQERDPNSNLKTVIPTLAAKRVEFYWPNHKKRLGKIPGVEIGDVFSYRAELCVVGVHGQFSCGIDFIKAAGMVLATSIVASGRYPTTSTSDELIYTGSGENPLVSKQEKVNDQKLIKGNLALFNSKKKATPVRVIRRKLEGSCFFYDGLYQVVDCWKKKGPFLKFVFKFKLKRLANQD